MEAHKCPDFNYGEVKPGTPEMQNLCLCTPISAEQRMLGMNTCRVHCPVCEGQDHHWMPDCDARKEYVDDDDEAEAP